MAGHAPRRRGPVAACGGEPRRQRTLFDGAGEYHQRQCMPRSSRCVGPAPSTVAATVRSMSADDAALLEAVRAGEVGLNGMRNREMRARLFTTSTEGPERKRQSAAVTRGLALLRAHGLIKKVTGTNRWVLTDTGRRVITALLTARQANVDQLTKLAA